MLQLSSDVLLSIFSLLTYKDILNLSTISRSLRDLCNNEHLWKKLYLNTFELNPSTPLIEEKFVTNWRDQFRKSCTYHKI